MKIQISCMFLLCYNIVNKSSSSVQLHEKLMYKDMRNAIKNSMNFCCYYAYSSKCVCKYKIHNSESDVYWTVHHCDN